MINLLPKILPRTGTTDRRAEFERHLINHEAEIGSHLFGPIPKGHKRQFFALDQHTWIWYEEWTEKGRRRAVTTRYEVRPNGIIKVQDDQPAQILSAEETTNLRKAAWKYYELVNASYQRMLTA